MIKSWLLFFLTVILAVPLIILVYLSYSAEQPNTKQDHSSKEFSKDPITKEIYKPDSINLLQRNLIGKNTFQLNTYASHTCWAHVLQDSIEGFSISKITLSIDSCQTGKSKIILAKALYRHDDKMIFEVKDELLVENHMPDSCYALIRLAITADSVNRFYLANYLDNRKEMTHTIHKLWLIDLAHAQLKPVNVPVQFRCFNPDYMY